MDISKLSTGELIAGASGLTLIVVLFLPWYGVDVNIAGFAASGNASAWEAFSFIDILLFLVSLAAMAIVAAKASGNLSPDVPAPVVLLGLGALAVLLVIYRIIDIPAGDVPDGVDLSRKLGVFIALIGAAAVAYGGWRTNEESPGRVAPTTPPAA